MVRSKNGNTNLDKEKYKLLSYGRICVFCCLVDNGDIKLRRYYDYDLI